MSGCLRALAVLLGVVLLFPGLCTVLVGTYSSGLSPWTISGIVAALVGGLLFWGGLSGA